MQDQEEVSVLLQTAHPMLMMNCPDMFDHAQHGYRMGGRGALTVLFDSIDALRSFILGGTFEQRVNYFDLLQVMRFNCPMIDEYVSTYDPMTSFVLVTSVLNPVTKQLGFSAVLAPRDAVSRLMLQFMLSRAAGGSPIRMMPRDPPPRRQVKK